MENTLVWQLMERFSKEELREAGEFVCAAFVNKREDVKAIYFLLEKTAKKGKRPPGKEEVFATLFPGDQYDDQEIRLIISYLHKTLEQYLLWRELQSNAIGHQHLLLAAYRKKGLSAHFQKKLNKSLKEATTQPLRHAELYLEKYAIEHERYLFLSETGRTKELNLQEMEVNLTAATLGLKLRQACFMRSHETVFNARYQPFFLEETLRLAQMPPFSSIPAVSLYFACYHALFLPSGKEGFPVFKAQLFENVGLFPQAEMRDLYLLAINFCIKKVNDGDAKYYREALDLYKSGLQTGLLIKDGRLSRFTYNNVVAVAIRLPDEWAWANQFVAGHKEYLSEEHREAAFCLNSARLEYVRKNYHSALIFLQKADYKDLINNMVAKVLQMKIYYEMQALDLLDSHLRTMRMFVRRNKKMGYHRDNWTNIIRYTQKLVEVNPFDDLKRQQLRQQIEQEETLTEKEWLLQQLMVND